MRVKQFNKNNVRTLRKGFVYICAFIAIKLGSGLMMVIYVSTSVLPKVFLSVIM